MEFGMISVERGSYKNVFKHDHHLVEYKMNRLLLCCLVILLPLLVLGQKLRLDMGKARKSNYYEEIPFEYVKSKIIIPVTIEGETYRFLLDTGAPNVLSQDLYNKITTHGERTTRVRDANEQKGRLKMVSVPELTLGNTIFENTPVLVYDLHNGPLGCFKIDGFIGSNLLRKSILQISLQERLLRITDRRKKLDLNKKNAHKISLRGDQKSPYLWIDLDGEQEGGAREHVLIDTGMSGFYDISSSNYAQMEHLDIFTVVASSEGASSISLFGTAKVGEQQRLLVPKIGIGNTTFHNLVTETTDDNNSRIGSDILEYGTITIDFKNKRFYFNAKAASIDLQEKQLSFTPAYYEDRFIIGFVWDDSLKDTLAFGDELLKVNGVDMAQMDKCEFFKKESIFEQYDQFHLEIRTKEGAILNIKTERKHIK